MSLNFPVLVFPNALALSKKQTLYLNQTGGVSLEGDGQGESIILRWCSAYLLETIFQLIAFRLHYE